LLRRKMSTMSVGKSKAAASRRTPSLRVECGSESSRLFAAPLAAAQNWHDARREKQGGGKPPHSTKAHRALVTDRPDRLSHRCAAFLLRGGERQ
jgi:hypothetical protein